MAKAQEKTGPFWMIFKAMLWFLLCVLFGIVLEWFIMTKYYPEQGAYRSLRLLEAELSYLSNTQLVTTHYGNTLISKLLSAQQHTYLFVTDTLKMEAALTGLSDLRFIQHGFNRMGLLDPHIYAVSMLNMINVITLKVVVILLSLPIFLILMIWAINAGLVQRAIRKYQVRNESSWIFHHAKRIKFWSIVLPVIVYLTWPNELSPLLIFGPCAIAYGASWFVMASKFKKNW